MKKLVAEFEGKAPHSSMSQNFSVSIDVTEEAAQQYGKEMDSSSEEFFNGTMLYRLSKIVDIALAMQKLQPCGMVNFHLEDDDELKN
jgi:hypothetical protein